MEGWRAGGRKKDRERLQRKRVEWNRRHSSRDRFVLSTETGSLFEAGGSGSSGRSGGRSFRRSNVPGPVGTREERDSSPRS